MFILTNDDDDDDPPELEPDSDEDTPTNGVPPFQDLYGFSLVFLQVVYKCIFLFVKEPVFVRGLALYSNWGHPHTWKTSTNGKQLYTPRIIFFVFPDTLFSVANHCIVTRHESKSIFRKLRVPYVFYIPVWFTVKEASRCNYPTTKSSELFHLPV